MGKETEQHASHSFSVISYVFFFFFKQLPFQKTSKKKDLGWSNILLQFLTIMSCCILGIKQANRIQCDLRN